MKDHIFKTLFNESSNEAFKLNIYFEESGFHLTIIEDLSAWKASVTLDDLKILANKLDCSVGEYYEKLSNYLSEFQEDITFLIENDNFIVHQIIRNKDNLIRVKFFHCSIEKADYKKTVECLLDNFFVNSREVQTKFETMQKQYEIIHKRENESRNKLEEFVYTKRLQEEDLYKNFVIILNEKKKRIQHLYELLEAFKKGRSPTNPTIITKKYKRKKQKIAPGSKKLKSGVISDSESEKSAESGGYKTDDSQSGKLHLPNEQSNNNVEEYLLTKPSTSKASDLFSDDRPASSIFDLLEADSPPRDVLLPRRLKKAEDSQFHNPCSNVQMKAGDSENADKRNGVPKNEGEEKPTVDFNTQDLLDML